MTDAPSSRATGLPAIVEIDASGRLPLFVLFVSSAIWLLVGSGFELLSTLKFHTPNLLADCPWFTYGRVRPAYMNAAIYGFCLQAGLAVALWLIARLGGTRLSNPVAITIGAGVFNLGVTLGVLGILGGDATGFENFDFPGYAAIIIFLGYLLISIPALLTFHQRRERALFVSQWFLLAALFWFPWIYSTADLLLLIFPVRGVAQAIIAWWFSNNLLFVWLSLVGLATIFYFIPKLTDSELYSRYLALLTFWFLILFGSWSGIPPTAPVPAWIPSLSTVGTVLMVIPVVTLVLNIRATLRGQRAKLKASLPLQFVWFGAAGFIVAVLLNIFASLPPFSGLVAFTWFNTARLHAMFYGFFTITMFGAIYYLLPRVAGLELPFPKLVRAHLWVAGLGILLIILPLALGGVLQGLKLKNPDVAFTEISKVGLHFLRVSTLGDLMIALGHVFLLINVVGLVNRFLRPRAVAGYEAATADLFQTAEAKP
jgi:cytochrome c oxidase cbb3-type subunit 1